MATFNYEVSPYRKGDGTRVVKIRMTHRRHVIRKSAGIYCSDGQLTRDRSKIRDAQLLEAVEGVLGRLRKAAASVDGAEWMDGETLWRHINARLEAERGFTLDFYQFADTVTATMERGTADGYKYALNALRKFTGRDTIDINEIDRALVTGFREWVERRNGKGCRAASAYLSKLRTVHDRARDRFNDEDVGLVRIPRQPFRGQIPPQPAPVHRALTVGQLRQLWATTPTTFRTRMARDVFFLSFALVGMNTADLYLLPKGCVRGGVMSYRRAKTDSRRADHAEMLLRVEPEAAELLARWRGFGSLLSFAERYADFRNFNKAVNTGLKDLGLSVGVPRLTTYHARHTWATLARNECGVPFDTIHEALNHARGGADRVTDIYVERDWSRVWEANRAVLDLLKV